MDTIQFDLFNPPQDDTLTKARKNVMEGRLVGVYCPCCDQLAKMYKISISVNQVRLLFKLYALTLHKATPGDEYFHITRDISKGVVDNVGGSFAKLVYWHMIEGNQMNQRRQNPGRVDYGRYCLLEYHL